MKPDERLASLVPVREFSEDQYLLFATKQGVVKKTRLSEFGNPRSVGIRAINIEKGDELIDVQVTDGRNDSVLATRQGMRIRFHEKDVRDMGRTATGVKGIELDKKDHVIDMVAVRPISRTSFSWDRMLMPCRVASTMSLRPSVTCTSISSSPFSMLMARMPTERGLPNSESRVFFTTPLLVANRRHWSSENSRTGTRAASRSSGFIATQEMIGLPRAARAACPISCTLSQ